MNSKPKLEPTTLTLKPSHQMRGYPPRQNLADLGSRFHLREDRVVRKTSAHIRAFAAEVIACVYVLNFFAHLVLDPTSALPEYTACLQHLHVITVVLEPQGVLPKWQGRKLWSCNIIPGIAQTVLRDWFLATPLLTNALAALQVLLCSGDQVVGRIAELRSAVRLHHAGFVALYKNVAKPKLHYVHHVVECIEEYLLQESQRRVELRAS